MVAVLLALAMSLQEPERPVQGQLKITMPILVTVEGGSKVADVVKGRSPKIRLVPVAGGKTLETSLASTGLAMEVTSDAREYRVRVEDLPEGYVVKSMTFKSADVADNTIRASLENFKVFLAPPRIPTYTGAGELQAIVNRVMQPPPGLTITLAPKPYEILRLR